jgi:hypothetical protein
MPILFQQTTLQILQILKFELENELQLFLKHIRILLKVLDRVENQLFFFLDSSSDRSLSCLPNQALDNRPEIDDSKRNDGKSSNSEFIDSDKFSKGSDFDELKAFRAVARGSSGGANWISYKKTSKVCWSPRQVLLSQTHQHYQNGKKGQTKLQILRRLNLFVSKEIDGIHGYFQTNFVNLNLSKVAQKVYESRAIRIQRLIRSLQLRITYQVTGFIHPLFLNSGKAYHFVSLEEEIYHLPNFIPIESLASQGKESVEKGLTTRAFGSLGIFQGGSSTRGDSAHLKEVPSVQVVPSASYNLYMRLIPIILEKLLKHPRALPPKTKEQIFILCVKKFQMSIVVKYPSSIETSGFDEASVAYGLNKVQIYKILAYMLYGLKDRGRKLTLINFTHQFSNCYDNSNLE